jgi:glycosyltransferase involved in cell wall biosynthesis
MRPLHIGIDAHAIGARQGGNETYIRQLILALAALDRENTYSIYLAEREAVEEWQSLFARAHPNFTVRRLPPPTPIVRAPVALAFELRRRPVDLLHVQYTAPPFCPVPVVATIHDLAFEHHPETFTRRGSWQMKMTVRWTARRAVRLATVSQFSREDLLQTYRLPSEKVVVTYNGVEPRFQPVPEGPDEAAAVRRRWGISGPYILALGSLQPRKNLPRLVRAYGALRRNHPSIRHQLVIAGRDLWLSGEIHQQIAEEPWAGDIVRTGYVPEQDLPALYRSADLLVYPSFFEGFGLPPVEAMACGVPVVTSQVGSLLEICGEAAQWVDPYDEHSIERAIYEVLTDPARQASLRQAGAVQARRFDWRETAQRTLDLYREAYQSRLR